MNYQRRSTNGTILEQQRLTFSDAGFDNEFAEADALGRVHLFYSLDAYGPVYARLDPNGRWQGPFALGGSSIQPLGFAIHEDKMDIVGWYGQHWRYTPELGWRQAIEATALAYDAQGQLHMATQLEYFPPLRPENPGWAEMSQQLSLPADLHAPTLSFAHRFQGAGSSYEVLISSGVTTTQILSATAEHGWQHGWADLSAWAGQTLTVTFRLNQAAGSPVAHLNVDDVSVGSWMSPVITDVTMVEDGGQQTITVSGENFIATPTVLLDGVQLDASAVTWIDAHTLAVIPPAPLALGPHPVQVINPGNYPAWQPGTLVVGKVIWLPLVMQK